MAPQSEQVPVATDEVLCLPDNRALQHGIIIGVGSDDFQCARNHDDPGEGANLVGGLRRFGDVEAAFELKFFGKFSENRFAGQRQAFALARCLNTLVRISQPADDGKKCVRVEDDAGNIIHAS